MSLHITYERMHSSRTEHWAEPVGPDQYGPWRVSWMPDREVTYNQAVTALTLAEAVAGGVDEGHRLWPHVGSWAGELGMTAEDAVVLVRAGYGEVAR